MAKENKLPLILEQLDFIKKKRLLKKALLNMPGCFQALVTQELYKELRLKLSERGQLELLKQPFLSTIHLRKLLNLFPLLNLFLKVEQEAYTEEMSINTTNNILGKQFSKSLFYNKQRTFIEKTKEKSLLLGGKFTTKKTECILS